MLSIEHNDSLTALGKGAPRATCSVRILYEGYSGTLGLIGTQCPRKRVYMSKGIPEQHALRCV